MKKILSSAILLAALLLISGKAQAAGFEITTEPKNITSAGSVDIKINITNDSSEAMSEIGCVGHGLNNPSQLYSQTIAAGRSLSITVRSVGINADMLGQPQTYAFTWLEGSTRKSKDVIVTFGSAAQPTAAMTATRTLSRDSGKEGDKITLTYTLKNPSTVAMTEVTVKDTIAGTKEIATPFTLEPGVSHNVTYEYTLGKENATTQPTVTYKVNGESKSLAIAAATIKITNVNLQVAVSQSEPAPEGTTFSIVLSNQGNQDISKITVTDELGVKVNAETFTLKAGEEKTLTHVVTTDTLRNVSFTITGTDASGQPYENRTRSSEARPYVDPGSIKFTMFVTVIEPLSESGRMKVRFAIQNDSTVEITNATISEEELGVLETKDKLQGGETIIEKELRISAPRELQFTLSAYDLSGTERTYQAQVPAAYMPTAAPTEEPISTDEPEDTPPVQPGIGSDTLITVLIVLAVLMGIAGIALLALSIYERKKGKEMPDYEDDLPNEPVRVKKAKIEERAAAPQPRPERNVPGRVGVREDKYAPPRREPIREQADREEARRGLSPQRNVAQNNAVKNEASIRQQYQEPARPQYQEPVRQQYQEPARPQYQESVRQQYQEPVRQQYQEPVRPQYQEPARPQHQEPVRQQYQEPTRQPQYQEPDAGQYQEPVRQQYREPARLQYQEEPARPQYAQPEKQAYQEPERGSGAQKPAPSTTPRNKVHRVKSD